MPNPSKDNLADRTAKARQFVKEDEQRNHSKQDPQQKRTAVSVMEDFKARSGTGHGR